MKIISIDIIHKLIKTKSESGFSGKIAILFESGKIVNVEKIQNMNNQRIAREVKRDHNSINKVG